MLDKRLTPAQCWAAADDYEAPIISIPGGEPLIHPEMPEIVRGLVERKKLRISANAIFDGADRSMEYPASKFWTFSVHMDGLRDEHDLAVCRDDGSDVAVKAIKAALKRGHRGGRPTPRCSDDANPERVRKFSMR